MNAHSLSFCPRCEELEEKNAPSMTCYITPPHGATDTVAVNVANPGCMNGIMTVMTTPAAGVITCPQMQG
jgi:hypothetical protein